MLPELPFRDVIKANTKKNKIAHCKQIKKLGHAFAYLTVFRGQASSNLISQM